MNVAMRYPIYRKEGLLINSFSCSRTSTNSWERCCGNSEPQKRLTSVHSLEVITSAAIIPLTTPPQSIAYFKKR
jgi:hypothetical protein